MANIVLDYATTTTLTFYLDNLDTNWQSGNRTAFWYLSYGIMPTQDRYDQLRSETITDGASRSNGVTFTGLEPEKTYGVYCVVCRGLSEPIPGAEFQFAAVTDAESIIIPKWNWNASNGIANKTATQNAYNAVRYKGATTNFSHEVWNDIVEKVQHIMDNAFWNDYWDSTYGHYSAIKMMNPNETLTASMFNAVRHNLERAGVEKLGLDMIPSTYGDIDADGKIPHPVNSGFIVFGHYFTTLTDYMNACIDNL